MRKIKGIPVLLYEQREIGKDDFDNPIYAEEPVVIENVLVSPATASEILDTTNLSGKKAVYTLAIPKGDTHDWKDKKIEFFGETFKSFGEPLKGIDEMIPLEWNMKVEVERYE